MSSELSTKQSSNHLLNDFQSETKINAVPENILVHDLNLQELAQNLRFESVLLALMMLLQEYPDNITIDKSILTVKDGPLELLAKLNFFMEYLCNIPFCFERKASINHFSYDFCHLNEEIQKILQVKSLKH